MVFLARAVATCLKLAISFPRSSLISSSTAHSFGKVLNGGEVLHVSALRQTVEEAMTYIIIQWDEIAE